MDVESQVFGGVGHRAGMRGSVKQRILQSFERAGRSLGATLAVAALASVIAPVARADVLVAVDKSTQQMTVSVDGEPRYQWSVSTGRSGYGTPNGTYRPQRLEKSWFSRMYYNSPMPHSIFFHGGYAIHGSYEINRLGGPASHGCIRLHPSNAATLFALVQQEGTGATTIVVSGQDQATAGRRGPAEDNADRVPLTPGYEPQYTPYYDRQPTVYPRQPRGFYQYPFDERY
jgi:lipoprotein-anchoring transpeptidase ErfK/SrfK